MQLSRTTAKKKERRYVMIEGRYLPRVLLRLLGSDATVEYIDARYLRKGIVD